MCYNYLKVNDLKFKFLENLSQMTITTLVLTSYRIFLIPQKARLNGFDAVISEFSILRKLYDSMEELHVLYCMMFLVRQ